jgi:hypothetical protein
MSTDNNMDFKAIADRMRELELNRDRPFSQPQQKDWKAELNEKLKPKPAPDQGDERKYYDYCC